MTSNLSSRNVRLIIGSQDWSAWIEADSGIQVGYPEYQVGSGLKPCEGTITLEFSAYDPNLPSNPNYLLNPSQWQREQTLSIEAVNDLGVLDYLPCSGELLYILKAPQAPKRSLDGLQQITLQVGCRLALEYFPPEPNKEASGVVAGTPLDRGAIITNILSFIGVPSAIGSIPYAIDYPLPKVEGNWIQMCGELASTAGYYLRCNESGIVIAEPINLLPSSSVRSYAIGEDEEFWESSGDSSEQPLEKLIVSGVRQIVAPVDTDPQVSIEEEALAKTYPDVFGQAGPGFSNSRQVFRRTTKSFDKTNDNLFEEKIFIEEALGLSYPDVFGQAGPGFSAALDSLSIEITEYFLDKGVCYKTVLIEIESLAKTYPDVFGQAGPGFSNSINLKRKTTKEWVKVKDGLWDLTTKIEEALGLSYPDVFGQAGPGFSSALALLSKNTKPDKSGPPTNFGELGENFIKEEPIKAEIFADQLAPNKNRQRQNTLKIPYAVSIEQLQAYGQTFNRFLSGRALGFQFSGKIEWLTPFNQVSVQEENIIYYLKVDGLQWAINQQKASTLWYGIVSGFANTETPEEIIRPVEISLGEFIMETKFNIYGIFDEPLTSEALTQFNIYAIPTITWSNLETQFNIYAINEVLSTAYKAYWAFEDIVSGYAINELGNTDYDLSISSGYITSGKVNNCIVSPSAAISSSVPNPFFDLYSNDFVGFALWIYPQTSGLGVGSIVEIISNKIAPTDLSWRLVIDFDAAQLLLDAKQIGLGDVSVSASVNIDDWNLVICEIDKIAQTLTIKVNNGTKQVTSSPITGNVSGGYLQIEAADLNIDELFFFSEPLDSGQESAIWNFGSGSVYPPF